MLSCPCFAMGFYSSFHFVNSPTVRLFVVMGGCVTLQNRAAVWWALVAARRWNSSPILRLSFSGCLGKLFLLVEGSAVLWGKYSIRSYIPIHPSFLCLTGDQRRSTLIHPGPKRLATGATNGIYHPVECWNMMNDTIYVAKNILLLHIAVMKFNFLG